MADIDKAMLDKLIQKGFALATQLREQGFYGEGSCREPCIFNATVKPLKNDRNQRLADEWEELVNYVRNTIKD